MNVTRVAGILGASPLWACTLVFVCTLAAPDPAAGALPDEIEVFDDALTPVDEQAVTLHLNTSPRGRTRPDFPGEVVPHHTTRFMIELSKGLRDGLEVGLHVPFLIERNGNSSAAGLRPRLRWIPHRPPEGSSGFFYGMNLEYSAVGQRFERPARHFEWKPILGYRGSEWLLAANPVLTWPLSASTSSRPDLGLNWSVKRHLSEKSLWGIEYYANYGPLGAFHPPDERDRTLFATADLALRSGHRLHLGIGRGLTAHSDRTIVKMIVLFP